MLHYYLCTSYLKGKVHPKNMLISDVRSEKIGKNAVDRFFDITCGSQDICKVKKLVIWRPPS